MVQMQAIRAGLALFCPHTMTPKTTFAAATLSLMLAASAWAQKVDYSFSGIYNANVNGAGVSMGYTGSFTIVDPLETSVKPAYAADVTAPNIAAVWSGTSRFYTGISDLSITFANGASLSAANLSLVLNNTTYAGPGSPYPMGLSAQLFTQGTSTLGMTASMVCANGTINAACDQSGDDPLYRQGDASDIAVQRLTGVYFAFSGAPLAPADAGVPNLVSAFNEAGLGVYSVDDQGHPVTTLTSFGQFSSVTSASAVPEPSTWILMSAGLLALAWVAIRRGSNKH